MFTTTKKIERLKRIYKKIISPVIKKHPVLQKNICVECYKEINNDNYDFDKYGMDTGICDFCNNTNEVLNEFLYFSYKELKFDFKTEVYGHVPRIFEKTIN